MMAPQSVVDLLRVAVKGGALGTYDFYIEGARRELMEPLKVAFERQTSRRQGWRDIPTIQHGAGAARQFAEWLLAESSGIAGIADVTPINLRRWYHSGNAGFPMPDTDISAVRTLLRRVDGLPESTRQHLARKSRLHPGEPYSDEEQAALVSASWDLIDVATNRIANNVDLRARFRSGDQLIDDVRIRIKGEECGAGQALEYLSRWGKLPARVHPLSQVAPLREYLGVTGRNFSDALFLSIGELCALEILFVAEAGYRPDLLREMEVGELGACEFDSSALVAQDRKSRAGAPDFPKTLAATRARLHGIGEFLTQPTRQTLAALGHETNLLFVARAAASSSRALAGLFITGRDEWGRRAIAWQRLTGAGGADGNRPALKRLRTAVRPSDESGICDFPDLQMAPDLVMSLGAAYRRLTAPGGEWSSSEAAQAGAGLLHRFVREITALNPGVAALHDITPDILSDWSAKAIRSAYGSREAVDLVRALLREAGWSSDAGTTGGSGGPAARQLDRPTAASLPAPGWRPPEPVSADGLTVNSAAGGGIVCDFTCTGAHDNVIKPIVAVFGRRASIGGSWNSESTVKGHERSVKRFVREIVAANPDLDAIKNLTAEMWWAWSGPAHGDPPARSVVEVVRDLLRDLDDLSDTTRQALNYTRPQKRKKRRPPSYSPELAKTIRDASLEMIYAACVRIDQNLEARDAFRSGEEPANAAHFAIGGAWLTVGQWLDTLSTNGAPPGNPSDKKSLAKLREALGLGPDEIFGQALFLTGPEVFALLTLFVCEGGYNLTSLNDLKAGGFRVDDGELDPELRMIEHDKPRRGSRRFSWEALIGQRVTLQEVAEFLTDPARETLAALGHPTDELFIACVKRGRSAHGSRRFRTDWRTLKPDAVGWSERAGVTDEQGRPLSVRRLRRTQQVISEVPKHNTRNTHWNTYLRDDPQTLVKARDAILRLQTRVVGDVRAHERQLRTLNAAELSAPSAEVARQTNMPEESVELLRAGELDTCWVACRCITDSPFADPGEQCPMSFFTCFLCPNAIMTPEHLPQVIALRDEIVARTRHLTDEEWQAEVGDFVGAVEDAIAQFSSDDIATARAKMTETHTETARTLLDYEGRMR